MTSDEIAEWHRQQRRAVWRQRALLVLFGALAGTLGATLQPLHRFWAFLFG